MKKTVLFLILLFTLTTTYARKFYFSSTGSDSHTTTQAQNPLTPWKTLAKLNSLSSIAAAGDTFAFKRGEIFANGSNIGNTGSVKWFGGGYEGRNFPSGTAANPIVFTYYGDMNLERPNLLYPNPTTIAGNQRNVLAFANVSWIVIDGIQFNDTRFPVNDKRSGAFTCAGLWFGDSGYCSDSELCKCSNITIKNCNFSNIVYGIVCFMKDAIITNNTFSNFKSSGYLSDTLGNNDIGADPIICSGARLRITNNRFTGSWAYCNPATSSTGLLGGALETINDFDSSFVAYNTFIDCSGGMEFGTNVAGGSKGPNDDTICYNKFINCSNITFLNTTGQFGTQAKNVRFWNNFFVEGSKSRMSGYEAGGDAMGDGQTYANTGFIYWPPYPPNKSIRYPASQNFQNAWRPIAAGVTTGQLADTVFDIRNNIFWINNGFFAKYSTSERGKIFYRNNIYHLVSGYQNPAEGAYTPTSLGSSSNTTLATGERIINSKLIVDSSSVYPQDWDVHIASDTSYAAFNGTNVGLTRDFEGNIVGATPSIGIYQYNSVAPTPCTFTYGDWGTCSNGVQTRPYITSPTGCVGFPPTDSISRTCTTPIVPCTFTFGTWTNCNNGTQTRTYTSTPMGCTGVPPTDSITRTCTIPCTFIYSPWSTCINGIQNRTYTSGPIGCIGVPAIDSLQRTCSSVNITSFYYNSDRRSIYINSNTSGNMVIKNILGSTVKRSRYSTNGDWVGVKSLPSGSYVATTYGQSILFIKQ